MWSHIPRTFSSGFRLLQYFLFSHYFIYYLLGFLAHADWVYVHSEYPGPKHCSYLSILWIFIDMRRSKYWMMYTVQVNSMYSIPWPLWHQAWSWSSSSPPAPCSPAASPSQTDHVTSRPDRLPVQHCRMKQSSFLYTRVEWNKQTYCTSG